MTSASIAEFADLLRLARAEPQPQQLLFVFVKATLPEAATPAQRAAFDAGEAGELEPLMTVDKAADALADFESLAAEAGAFGPPWSLVFVSTQPGGDANTDAIGPALDEMVERVRAGWLSGMVPFDRRGRAVALRP
jgi:hypothetical protein